MGLTFKELSDANIVRCQMSFHPIRSWSETDWGCAVAGEVGEMCNLLKKRLRGENIPIDDLGKEIADAVTYLDLLCSHLGISLEKCVLEKFNEVSDRIGSNIYLKSE